MSLIAFDDGSSLQITPQGYYDFQGDSAEDNIDVRVGDRVSGIGAYREKFYRPALGAIDLERPETAPTIWRLWMR